MKSCSIQPSAGESRGQMSGSQWQVQALLCDLGQVTALLWSSLFPSVKGRGWPAQPWVPLALAFGDFQSPPSRGFQRSGLDQGCGAVGTSVGSC